MISTLEKQYLYFYEKAGSRSRTRTYDPAINSRLLYQLSYSGPARHRITAFGGARKPPYVIFFIFFIATVSAVTVQISPR